MRDPDTPVILTKLGRRVAELRAKAGLTQEELAKSLDHSLKYQQRIEAGTHNLSVDALVRLARVLSCRVADLFDEPATLRVNPGRPRKTARDSGGD